MGEEFYAIIKLVSGEEIMSLVMVDEDQDNPIVILQNPVTIKTFTNNYGIRIGISPWMELSEDDCYFIKMDKIITITETSNKRLINLYDSFLNEDESSNLKLPGNNSNQTKLNSDMGYITSVDDAKKKLESIFQNLSVDDCSDL